MMLLLRVLRARNEQHARGMSRRFDQRGGTIGRVEGNDWMLPDADSLVSRRHARIEFRDGAYYLVDLSTNGVFVNASTEPLGLNDAHQIQHGDQFRLGDYVILAELEDAPVAAETPTPPPPRPASPRAPSQPPRVQVRYEVGADAQSGGDLNLDISVDDGATGDQQPPTSIRVPMDAVHRMRSEEGADRVAQLKEILDTRDDLGRLRDSLHGNSVEGLLTAVVDDLQAARSIPIEITDGVHFSVSGPASMRPGNWYTVDVWVHTAEQRKDVLERANDSQSFAGVRIKTRGPVRLTRDSVLNVEMRMPDFHVSDTDDTLIWTQGIGSAGFAVLVPERTEPGTYPGTATFHVDQFRVAQVHFTLLVAQERPASIKLDSREVRYATAFASYASDEHDAVIGHVQNVQRVLPSLDVFLDVASLRSGERWANRLTEEIRRRDVFYLFWSRAASLSPWVEREWRTAWRYRGLDVIDPVPIESPDDVAPPADLAEHLHFNDWVLAFRRGRRTDA